jgi:hypothetical protein
MLDIDKQKLDRTRAALVAINRSTQRMDDQIGVVERLLTHFRSEAEIRLSNGERLYWKNQPGEGWGLHLYVLGRPLLKAPLALRIEAVAHLRDLVVAVLSKVIDDAADAATGVATELTRVDAASEQLTDLVRDIMDLTGVS